MKASKRSVRCGVVAEYWCQTCAAISAGEALVFNVAGPEERVDGVVAVVVVGAVAAEVVEDAWRLDGMVVVGIVLILTQLMIGNSLVGLGGISCRVIAGCNC